ncbi:MAG: sulfatase family protein [Flavisolibacter sp.]
MQIVSAQSKPSHPNIIVIMTDEQSTNAMSYSLGKQWLNTPAMDQLASEGVVFNHAYAADPICVPSRNSLITGRFPHQINVLSNDDQRREGDGNPVATLGTYFKNAGYQTAYFGKWHLNYDPAKKETHGFETTGFATDRGKDAALPELADSFLKQRHDKPFLLFLSFINPHDVCEWARFQKLPEGSIGTVPPLSELPPLKHNIDPPKGESDAMSLIRQSYHNTRMFPVGNYSEADWRRLRWGYYRLLEKVDSLIGRVLASIKQNGYDNNTLIVFTSDHGESLGAHEFNQKTVFYEESAGVPFILRCTGQLQPSANSSLVNNGIDLIPTLLDFANIPKPTVLPGRSLKEEAIKNESIKDRPYIVVENRMTQGGAVNETKPVLNGRMVRSERYKYCLYDLGERREELYDLKNDPGETINIAGEKSSKEILKQHRNYLSEFAKKYKDTLALKMLNEINK